MRHIPNAHRVRQRFSKSVVTYATHAVVQKRMAERLCALLCAVTPQRIWPCVLDLGCGTGFLTDAILRHFQVDELWAYDMVEAFSACYAARENCHFVTADLNTFNPYPEADLVVSGATLQWIADVPALLQRLHHCTRTHARLAFSSFTPENFLEIATISERGLAYPTPETIQDWMKQAGWNILTVESERFVEVFADPRAVLRHLQRTGVTATGAARGWTKAELRQFEQKYEAFRLPEGRGYPLTYTPFYVVAERC